MLGYPRVSHDKLAAVLQVALKGCSDQVQSVYDGGNLLRGSSEKLMMQKPHEFELEDDARITDAESPDTEPLDSGDSYNAPERHWLARFSTVVFCIGLLAGVSGTTAVTNAWIQRDVSVVLMLLSAGSAAAFFGILWQLTLREIRRHSKSPVDKKRYRITTTYFWCAFALVFALLAAASYFLINFKDAQPRLTTRAIVRIKFFS